MQHFETARRHTSEGNRLTPIKQIARKKASLLVHHIGQPCDQTAHRRNLRNEPPNIHGFVHVQSHRGQIIGNAIIIESARHHHHQLETSLITLITIKMFSQPIHLPKQDRDHGFSHLTEDELALASVARRRAQDEGRWSFNDLGHVKDPNKLKCEANIREYIDAIGTSKHAELAEKVRQDDMVRYMYVDINGMTGCIHSLVDFDFEPRNRRMFPKRGPLLAGAASDLSSLVCVSATQPFSYAKFILALVPGDMEECFQVRKVVKDLNPLCVPMSSGKHPSLPRLFCGGLHRMIPREKEPHFAFLPLWLPVRVGQYMPIGFDIVKDTLEAPPSGQTLPYGIRPWIEGMKKIVKHNGYESLSCGGIFSEDFDLKFEKECEFGLICGDHYYHDTVNTKFVLKLEERDAATHFKALYNQVWDGLDKKLIVWSNNTAPEKPKAKLDVSCFSEEFQKKSPSEKEGLQAMLRDMQFGMLKRKRAGKRMRMFKGDVRFEGADEPCPARQLTLCIAYNTVGSRCTSNDCPLLHLPGTYQELLLNHEKKFPETLAHQLYWMVCRSDVVTWAKGRGPEPGTEPEGC
jgi:hypothetical protein